MVRDRVGRNNSVISAFTIPPVPQSRPGNNTVRKKAAKKGLLCSRTQNPLTGGGTGFQTGMQDARNDPDGGFLRAGPSAAHEEVDSALSRGEGVCIYSYYIQLLYTVII